MESVLTYDAENKRVVLSDEGYQVDAFKVLSERKDFQKIITFIYFLDYPESPYVNFLEKDSLKNIAKDWLSEKVVEKFVQDQKIEECRVWYRESVMSLAKLHYENFKREVNDFYETISKIKTTVDNGEKKYKLLAHANSLMDMEEKLSKRLDKDKQKTNVGNRRTRKFED